jgi:hypothetical protein
MVGVEHMAAGPVAAEGAAALECLPQVSSAILLSIRTQDTLSSDVFSAKQFCNAPTLLCTTTNALEVSHEVVMRSACYISIRQGFSMCGATKRSRVGVPAQCSGNSKMQVPSKVHSRTSVIPVTHSVHNSEIRLLP